MTNAVAIAQQGSNNTTFRNRIINGSMLIWQRATSLTTSSNQVYGFADRWCTNAGASTTWSQSTDAPTGFKYSVSCAGSTYNGINQRIESYNCTDLASQPVTISFWAKRSSGSGGISINLAYANTADTFSSTTTIVEASVTASPSSSWTRYSYTYTMPSQVVNGLQVILFNASAGSDTTLYTGIQVELGSAASPFENRLYTTELQLCQRYYWKAVNPHLSGVASNSTALNRMGTSLPVTMRSAPSISYSGTIQWYDGSASGTITSASSLYANTNSFEMDATPATGTTASSRAIIAYLDNSITGYFSISAEL